MLDAIQKVLGSQIISETVRPTCVAPIVRAASRALAGLIVKYKGYDSYQ